MVVFPMSDSPFIAVYFLYKGWWAEIFCPAWAKTDRLFPSFENSPFILLTFKMNVSKLKESFSILAISFQQALGKVTANDTGNGFYFLLLYYWGWLQRRIDNTFWTSTDSINLWTKYNLKQHILFCKKIEANCFLSLYDSSFNHQYTLTYIKYINFPYSNQRL